MASEEKGEKWRALLLKVAGVLSLIVILATFIKPPKTLDSCNSIINNGQWVGGQWYPYQCILSRYHVTRVLRECVRPSSARASPSVLFIGEKTLLEYFKALGDRLSNNELPDLSKDIQRNIPLTYNIEERQYNSDYMWMERFDHNVMEYYENILKLPAKSLPTLIVHEHYQYTGGGVARGGAVSSSNSCSELTSSLISLQNKYINIIKDFSSHSPTIIILLYKDHLLLNENDRNCQNELINKINEAIKVLPGFSESLVMFKIERNNELLQGLELISHFICKDREYGSCCIESNTTHYSTVVLPVLVVLVALYAGLAFVRATGTLIRMNALEPYFEGLLINLDHCYYFIHLTGTVLISLLYAVATDRLEYFVTAGPWQSFLLFFLLCIVIVCLGFMKRETATKQSPGGVAEQLPREQINELRGVAVLVMMSLEYSYVTESDVGSWVWLCMVGLITFATSYNSFNYYWDSSDYSIRSFIRVIFRYNYLTIWFCLALNSSMKLYTVPLIMTQTVFTVYVTMAIPPRVGGAHKNQKTIVVPVKLLISLLCVIIISAVELHLTGTLLGLDTFMLNQQLWTSPFIVNMVTLLGMFIAYYYRINNYLLSSVQTIKGLIALLSFLSYIIFIYKAKVTGYSQIVHSLLLSFLIIGYIMLRNWNEKLSSSYSYVCNHIGLMSIEFYVLFQHIMLSYNRKGLVFLFPSYYSINMMATLLILLFFALRLNAYTNKVNNSNFYLPQEEEDEEEEEERETVDNLQIKV